MFTAASSSASRPKICSCADNQAVHDHLIQLASKANNSESNIYSRLSILKAAKSIRLYPLPILCLEDALRLDGVGKYLAREILSTRAHRTCEAPSKENECLVKGNSDDSIAVVNCSSRVGKSNELKEPPPRVNPAVAAEDYKPERGKTPWALLLSVFRCGDHSSKEQIEIEAMNIAQLLQMPQIIAGFKSQRSAAARVLRSKSLLEQRDSSSTGSGGERFCCTVQGARVAAGLLSPEDHDLLAEAPSVPTNRSAGHAKVESVGAREEKGRTVSMFSSNRSETKIGDWNATSQNVRDGHSISAIAVGVSLGNAYDSQERCTRGGMEINSQPNESALLSRQSAGVRHVLGSGMRGSAQTIVDLCSSPELEGNSEQPPDMVKATTQAAAGATFPIIEVFSDADDGDSGFGIHVQRGSHTGSHRESLTGSHIGSHTGTTSERQGGSVTHSRCAATEGMFGDLEVDIATTHAGLEQIDHIAEASANPTSSFADLSSSSAMNLSQLSQVSLLRARLDGVNLIKKHALSAEAEAPPAESHLDMEALLPPAEEEANCEPAATAAAPGAVVEQSSAVNTVDAVELAERQRLPLRDRICMQRLTTQLQKKDNKHDQCQEGHDDSDSFRGNSLRNAIDMQRAKGVCTDMYSNSLPSNSVPSAVVWDLTQDDDDDDYDNAGEDDNHSDGGDRNDVDKNCSFLGIGICTDSSSRSSIYCNSLSSAPMSRVSTGVADVPDLSGGSGSDAGAAAAAGIAGVEDVAAPSSLFGRVMQQSSHVLDLTQEEVRPLASSTIAPTEASSASGGARGSTCLDDEGAYIEALLNQVDSIRAAKPIRLVCSAHPAPPAPVLTRDMSASSSAGSAHPAPPAPVLTRDVSTSSGAHSAGGKRMRPPRRGCAAGGNGGDGGQHVRKRKKDDDADPVVLSVGASASMSESSTSQDRNGNSDGDAGVSSRIGGKTLLLLPGLRDQPATAPSTALGVGAGVGAGVGLERDWEVILYVDKRERSNALIQASMVAQRIPCELHTLAVGDFLWVARRRAALPSSCLLTAPATAPGPASCLSHEGRSHQPQPSTTSTSAYAGQGQGQGLTLPPAEDSMVSLPDAGMDPPQPPPSSSSAASPHEEEGGTQGRDVNSVLMRSAAARAAAAANAAASRLPSIYVLDCIAERKAVPDLASSIVDGRYMEQKSRLQACGLRTTLYIVEGEHLSVASQQRAVSVASLKTAMTSIHVDSGMHVLRTRGMDHTISQLQGLHQQVSRRFYAGRCATHPRYQSFTEFQTLYSKRAAGTNKQLFGYQLRQVQGCGPPAALALMERFGTVANFMAALREMGKARTEEFVANLVKDSSNGNGGAAAPSRKIGPKLAQRICQLYADYY